MLQKLPLLVPAVTRSRMLRSKKRTTTFEGPKRSARYTRSEACYVHARVEFARQCAARLLRSGAHVEADAGAGHIHAGYRRTRCPETVCAAGEAAGLWSAALPRYRRRLGGGRPCGASLQITAACLHESDFSLLNGFNDNSSVRTAFRVTRFAHEVHESTRPARSGRVAGGRAAVAGL